VRRPTALRDALLARLFQWLDTEEGMTSMKAIDDVAAALQKVSSGYLYLPAVFPKFR
jgi:hypothetical protein